MPTNVWWHAQNKCVLVAKVGAHGSRSRSCEVATVHVSIATKAAVLLHTQFCSIVRQTRTGDKIQQTETRECKEFKRIQIELQRQTMLSHTKQTELWRGVSHKDMVTHVCPYSGVATLYDLLLALAYQQRRCAPTVL